MDNYQGYHNLYRKDKCFHLIIYILVGKFGSEVLSTVIHQMRFWHWKHNNINNNRNI